MAVLNFAALLPRAVFLHPHKTASLPSKTSVLTAEVSTLLKGVTAYDIGAVSGAFLCL
jgi:hypothetical protein